MAFKHRFPEHDIWAANKEDWWKEQLKDFKKSCKRSRIADPSVEEMRKSAPLYRDVSKARTLSTTIRAKYLNLKADAKGVAMGMLKEASCYSIQKLFEFALCWQAIGRGGEHVFLRWTEMRWDDLFQAPDFDWSMSKQSEKKCTLLFCDRFLYCLCPMFTMGLFMLFDGLRRDVEATKGAVKNYVFPLMHKMRKDGVAEALTKAIKKHIGNDFGVEFAKFYSSRSVRKGGMTHNRSDRKLSTQEEYARSGHMAPGMNGNAEGYIDSIPALSAPGGMSLAGYTDPHGEHVPMNLRCLGGLVRDSIERFISNLVVNDVECLQEDGINREVLVTCAACIIGWYNNLVRDVGNENPIVVRIHQAAQRSQLSDDSVTLSAGAPGWRLVLKSWSKRIKDRFEEDNPQMPSFSAPLTEQYMGISTQFSSVLSRLINVESSMAELSNSHNMLSKLQETNVTLVNKVLELTSELKKSQSKAEKLERRLDTITTAATFASPLSTPTAATRLETAPRSLAGNKRSSDEINEEVQGTDDNVMAEPSNDATEQAARAEVALEAMQPVQGAMAGVAVETVQRDPNAWGSLDGIVTSTVDLTKITVRTELECMWHSNKFKDKTDGEGNIIRLPKHALFDTMCAHFLGYNADMARDQTGQKKAYTDSMTVVAVSMEQRNWDTLREDSLTAEQMRQVVGDIIRDMYKKLKELEIEYLGRSPNSKFKELKNLRSVAGKWKKILSEVEKRQDVDTWLKGQLGEIGEI